MTTELTGGCQCGAVRYRLLADLASSHVCHCRMCQRATGGLFAALVGAQKGTVEWTKGTPSFFASSSLAQRGFCAVCGTPLSFAYEKSSARFYITIGSLDDPNAAPITRQFGVESQVGWVKFCEDVAREKTGDSLPPDMAGFYIGMTNNQS